MNEKLLYEYANLIVKIGANVQKGQYVRIRTNPSLEHFASIVADLCYKNGAKRVFFDFKSEDITKVEYDNLDIAELSHIYSHEEEKEKELSSLFPVLIWLDGDNPDASEKLDSNKIASVSSNRYKVLGKYKESQEGKAQWTIAGVPTIGWAKKVFPKLNDNDAIDSLWDLIFKVARVQLNKSVSNWQQHELNLKSRCKFLNELNLSSLHYSTKKGTDLNIELLDKVRFEGGSEKTIDGKIFQPNIPTEECFTTPNKYKTSGIVYSTKPLVYNGKIIEDFYFVFKEGRVEKIFARKNEATLRSILSLDEGASYLGECALVPFDSPINLTNKLFFNTLYDENASCHLAIGKGFPTLYSDYEKFSLNELDKIGINYSQSHVDFMVGDDTLNIIGKTKDGKEIQIFKNGTWAF